MGWRAEPSGRWDGMLTRWLGVRWEEAGQGDCQGSVLGTGWTVVPFIMRSAGARLEAVKGGVIWSGPGCDRLQLVQESDSSAAGLSHSLQNHTQPAGADSLAPGGEIRREASTLKIHIRPPQGHSPVVLAATASFQTERSVP